MNQPDHERELERAIDRELQSLPLIPAPARLASRVLATIERRAERPWYRLAWESWPMPLRAISFCLLAAGFAALCFAAWQLSQHSAATSASAQVSGWLSAAAGLWKVLSALGNAIVLSIKQLGTGFLVGCIAAMALGYAACVALGSACVKLSLARRY